MSRNTFVTVRVLSIESKKVSSFFFSSALSVIGFCQISEKQVSCVLIDFRNLEYPKGVNQYGVVFGVSSEDDILATSDSCTNKYQKTTKFGLSILF